MIGALRAAPSKGARTAFLRASQRASRRASAPSAPTSTMASVAPIRPLHWVFKVGDRKATCDFYQKLLGMTVLRHEEFEQGCEASCNGPYDNKWSKTMIGYGEEDAQFVLELTYNYNVKGYQLGNDLRRITLCHPAAYAACAKAGVGRQRAGGDKGGPPCLEVAAPDGYLFRVVDQVAAGGCPVTEVELAVASLPAALAFWSHFLGFKVLSQQQQDGGDGGTASALLSAGGGDGQCGLRLTQLPAGQAVQHGTAFGRIAFACPGGQLQQLQADVLAVGFRVHTPHVSLDTPGKATVQVVILADPDGHEICFVGEEGFRELSAMDPEAPRLLEEALAADRSAEWLARRAAVEAQVAAEKARA